MASNVYIMVYNCTACPCVCARFCEQGKLEWFPFAGPLEFVAIHIFGPLPNTEARNRFVVIMTDRYAKLIRAKLTTRITLRQVPSIILNVGIMRYGLPDTVLSDNGQRCVSKLFTSLCSHLGTSKLKTTVFYQQTNGYVEMYIKTLLLRP